MTKFSANFVGSPGLNFTQMRIFSCGKTFPVGFETVKSPGRLRIAVLTEYVNATFPVFTMKNSPSLALVYSTCPKSTRLLSSLYPTWEASPSRVISYSGPPSTSQTVEPLKRLLAWP